MAVVIPSMEPNRTRPYEHVREIKVAQVVNGKVMPDTSDKVESKGSKSLYGAPEFSASDNGSVSERYGKRSTAAVDITVPIASLGLKISTTLWCNLDRRSDGDRVIPSVRLPKNVKAIDTDAKDRFIEHIEDAIMAWPGYEPALMAAEKRLIDGGAAKVNAAGKVSAFAPRLVKRSAAPAVVQ